MRAILNIDDDVLEAVKRLARQSDRTAGAVLSELARRTLTRAPTNSGFAEVGGFVPFKSRGGLVTNEKIDRLREPSVESWLQQVRKRKRAMDTKLSIAEIIRHRDADRR